MEKPFGPHHRANRRDRSIAPNLGTRGVQDAGNDHLAVGRPGKRRFPSFLHVEFLFRLLRLLVQQIVQRIEPLDPQLLQFRDPLFDLVDAVRVQRVDP